mmetsp:Transcript_75709/g.152112  ORF Transcript_75709/g.152112 Transcript_75709/m.152112 type:complete len:213 (+) Transcript_75709:728-1366(+)
MPEFPQESATKGRSKKSPSTCLCPTWMRVGSISVVVSLDGAPSPREALILANHGPAQLTTTGDTTDVVDPPIATVTPDTLEPPLLVSTRSTFAFMWMATPSRCSTVRMSLRHALLSMCPHPTSCTAENSPRSFSIISPLSSSNSGYGVVSSTFHLASTSAASITSDSTPKLRSRSTMATFSSFGLPSIHSAPVGVKKASVLDPSPVYSPQLW